MADIKVKCHFAYNEAGDMIDIKVVTKEYRSEHKFRCLACGAEMRAKLGDYNQHHFAHMPGTSCCGETYLHYLAKTELKKAFDESETFEISYKRKVRCCKECVLRDDEKCIDYQFESFDLKKYYDTCSLEKYVNGFCADLLFLNSKNSKIPPLFIEIEVSHPCSQEKLDSGLKIVEIKLKSDYEIFELIRQPLRIEESEAIKFHNFKQNSTDRKILAKRQVLHFSLFNNGNAHVSNYEDMPLCNIRKSPSTKCEFKIDDRDCTYINWGVGFTAYDYGFVKAMDLGYDVRVCALCKYISLTSAYCKKHHYYNTPKNPANKEAMTCKYYSLNFCKVRDVREQLQKIRIEEVK